MKWNRFYPMFMLAMLWVQPILYAQTHVNTWFRLSLQGKLSERLRSELEFQHRRQNTPDQHSPFAAGLMYAVRPWFLYQWSKGVEVGFSPLAWFRHNSIVIRAEDVYKKPQHEYRTSIGITIKEKAFERLLLFERTALEYRMFADGTHVLRARFKPGLQYSFGNRLSLTLYDEVLLNAVGVMNAHIYDHNRIAISLGCQCARQVYVETAYVRISRLPAGNPGLLQESNFLLNARYHLK